MSKSRPFSIYLLKPEFNAGNALKDNHGLDVCHEASGLPEGSILYVLDNSPHPPWWKSYFQISKDLTQVTKGALLFLLVNGRTFALSFGYVHHHLKDICYEYDFGLRVTLNSIIPKFKSADTLDPGSSRRQRTQFPIESDLTYFDFDKDSTIIKRLTGKVKDEYKELFNYATGSSSLKININVPPARLTSICERLLSIYQSEDYKINFPDIQNIEPVKDPTIIARLNEKLLEAFKGKDINLTLAVPDIINYHSNVYACFSGSGGGDLSNDVSMEHYYAYLQKNEISLNDMGINNIESHDLDLTDDNAQTQESFNVFKCMIFDTTLDNNDNVYHLCDGNWYKVDNNYIRKMKIFLDPYYEDVPFLAYNHGNEGCYNKAIATTDKTYICLDQKNIGPEGQNQVEPCDLYKCVNNQAYFYHVKISTRSSQLSHLFNQGVNAIELIKSEEESRCKLKELIKNDLNTNTESIYLSPIDQQKYKVVFVIVTHKNKSKKSDNFPLFSRISLMRSLKAFRIMSVDAAYCFAEDTTVRIAGMKKSRKSKKSQYEEKVV